MSGRGLHGVLDQADQQAAVARRLGHLSPARMPHTDSEPQKLDKALDVADRIAQEILQRRPQFLQHRRKDLGAMQEAVAQQDYEAIRTMGHRIKGVAGSYGFPDIGAVGQRLEESARSRDLVAIQGEIAQLAAILHQLDQAA